MSVIPIGYKQTEVGVIPEDWEVKKVKQFGEIVTGSTPLTGIKEFWNGDIPWITPTDISDKKDIFASERQITYLGLSSIRKLPGNSVLITCIASIGKNTILRNDGACNQQINAIIPNKEHNVDFLYYLIESKKQYLLGNAGITATLIISKKDFSELDFTVPPLPEQNAIAAVFSDADALIESLEQLIAKKRHIKQGAMQELLTGKTRLPGFPWKTGDRQTEAVEFGAKNPPYPPFPKGGEFVAANPPPLKKGGRGDFLSGSLSGKCHDKQTDVGGIPDGWEVKKVKQFGEIVTGSTPLTGIKEFWNGDIPWITPTDISDKKDIFASERQITYLGLSSIRKLPGNSVLITCIASIGKNTILRNDGACNQQINAIIPNKEHNVDFLYYLIESKKQYLLGNAGITATLIISKKDFSELDFTVPPLPEQNAIAAVLSDMDTEITNLEAQLDKTRAIKQGMMQKLLTGEIRLI